MMLAIRLDDLLSLLRHGCFDWFFILVDGGFMCGQCAQFWKLYQLEDKKEATVTD